ncbi:unnamed protein product [Blepharisma stoltei]|uniref:Uncharacterized protein n=1 Tax=Blepharisma stoltei TaxID=1481888 RepID=A0AAU9J0K2_9CILI|nr:unnamed protein product [Blepharisma stoltei]
MGKIYESIRDDKSWVEITNLDKFFGDPSQVYCSYNKEAIYIGCGGEFDGYYKFSLSQKTTYKLEISRF